jgi:hypothetical protein
MSTIAETNVLLRAQAEFPAGFKVATEDVLSGWRLMRTGGAQRLKQKIQSRGWSFLELARGALRSGVGASEKEAVSSALRLSLRRLDSRSNAVEIEGIELTKYPWFFLARVRIRPYRFQPDAELPAAEIAEPEIVEEEEAVPHLANIYPKFGAAMPMLKEMLLSSRA